jgi:hypothetical protein
LEEDLAHLKRLAERSRRMGGGRVQRVVRVERAERDEPRPRRYEEPRARHALTPREREREREKEWHARRSEEEAREVRAAGHYLHRGVDRLLERPPEDWRRRRD